MDEDQFRSAYHELNPERCIFEKSINALRCNCSDSQRFLLAGRHGVKCKNSHSKKLCQKYLDTLRNDARFALKLTSIDQPLPHKKEIKVQLGGLLGLQNHLTHQSNTNVDDIIHLLKDAITHYGDIQHFPFDEIIQSLVHFEIRTKHKNRED